MVCNYGCLCSSHRQQMGAKLLHSFLGAWCCIHAKCGASIFCGGFHKSNGEGRTGKSSWAVGDAWAEEVRGDSAISNNKVFILWHLWRWHKILYIRSGCDQLVDKPEYTGPMPALTFQNGQLLVGGTKTITQITWRADFNWCPCEWTQCWSMNTLPAFLIKHQGFKSNCAWSVLKQPIVACIDWQWAWWAWQWSNKHPGIRQISTDLLASECYTDPRKSCQHSWLRTMDWRATSKDCAEAAYSSLHAAWPSSNKHPGVRH